MSKLLSTFFLSCIVSMALGQTNIFLNKISSIDSININRPLEKIFVHYDKLYYTLKDTLWLKGYIFEAKFNKPNDSSRIAYVEFINENREIVKRFSFQSLSGTFFGNVFLDEDNFKQGEYILRAYTNYQRNFGDSLFFESSFKIVDLLSEEWNVSVREINFDKDRISLLTSLKNANQQPLANKKVTVRVRSKNKNLLRINTVTDHLGYIKIDTIFKNLNDNNLSLEVHEGDNLKLKMPLRVNGKEQIDLQFFPEGGKFIAGKMQRTGLKALDIYGKGVDVQGIIRDSKNNDVATFNTIHKGMGIVQFKPEPNEKYTAYTLDGQSFALPAVYNSGILLQVFNTPHSDSIKIIMEASSDMSNNNFYLSASTKGINAAHARLRFSDKPVILNLAKNVFPSGITRFTLYDANLNPVNERITFIKHNDDLKITLQPHKKSYQKKDSVHIALHAQNNRTENITASFSVAVIDTGQVKINTNAENIISYMLLSSDLKGHIEEPYYYFNNPDSEALEALLLTQGWVDYNWKTSLQKFEYEKEFTISGRVSDVFNKPSRNVSVLLFAKMGLQQAVVIDTVTNGQGRFLFTNFPAFKNDSVTTVIRALNKRGKAFNVGIELDKIDYPAYHSDFIFAPSDAIVLDTLIKKYVTNQAKIAEEMRRDKEYLGEVVVTTNARIPGSKNLNEDGGSDQIITENALNNFAKESLLDVLYKKVEGFNRSTRAKSTVSVYKINGNEIKFIIDGIELDWFFQGSANPNDYIYFLDSHLKYFYGEDVKGIEVMISSKYKRAYTSEFLLPKNPFANDWDIAYIEITTKTGKGPFMKRVPGIYLYKPLVPVIGKQFYSPKYTSEEESTLPDFRSTVYWAPHVITDEQGKAEFSFYTSESNSNYLIILQGTDFMGGMGVLYQPLMREKNESTTSD